VSSRGETVEFVRVDGTGERPELLLGFWLRKSLSQEVFRHAPPVSLRDLGGSDRSWGSVVPRWLKKDLLTDSAVRAGHGLGYWHILSQRRWTSDSETNVWLRPDTNDRSSSDFYSVCTELEELAAHEGIAVVTNFDDLLGDFWPEDESEEEFNSTVRKWRLEGG